MGNLYRGVLLGFGLFLLLPQISQARDGGVCPRPPAGSEIARPPDLYSSHGLLKLALNYYTSIDNKGRTLFCFVTPDGAMNPTLHVNPGDEIRIALTNQVSSPHGGPAEMISNRSNVCGNAQMDLSSVNMHFHGTNTSPRCGSDEAIHTLVNSGETFNYTLKFPKNEPPGLYWYHPHVHGVASAAVEGGATGLIEVEGIANIQPAVAGLPERYLVIRDQHVILHPNESSNIKAIPSWDLSLNYVPVSYPRYRPAVIKMKSGQQEFWRVANTSANTIIDLKLNYDHIAQPLQIVAFDGVPTGSQDGKHQGTIVTQKDILLPPASRVEFIVAPPSKQVQKATLMTLPIDGGATDDATVLRPLAEIQLGNGPATLPRMPSRHVQPNAQRFDGLVSAKITAKRQLYFSEQVYPGGRGAIAAGAAKQPEGQTAFFITVKGQQPEFYDPNNPPAIITNKGAVEEWIIENHSQEVHEFHIHQIHFLLEEVGGVKIPKEKQQFYDTIQVPYWDGVSQKFPSVKLKMDFRGAVVGDFVYHCHILEHEDAGMMAIIRVLPPGKKESRVKPQPVTRKI